MSVILLFLRRFWPQLLAGAVALASAWWLHHLGYQAAAEKYEPVVAAQSKRIETLVAYAEQRDAAIAACAGLNDGLAAQVGELNRLNADLARANRDLEARARQRAADLDTRVAEDRRAAAARRAGADAPPADEMRAALARALGAGP